MKIYLPTFEEAKRLHEEGQADPISAIIYENEPADLNNVHLFRDQVQAALDHAYAMGAASVLGSQKPTA